VGKNKDNSVDAFIAGMKWRVNKYNTTVAFVGVG
jgi:hypothetical protein